MKCISPRQKPRRWPCRRNPWVRSSETSLIRCLGRKQRASEAGWESAAHLPEEFRIKQSRWFNSDLARKKGIALSWLRELWRSDCTREIQAGARGEIGTWRFRLAARARWLRVDSPVAPLCCRLYWKTDLKARTPLLRGPNADIWSGIYTKCLAARHPCWGLRRNTCHVTAQKQTCYKNKTLMNGTLEQGVSSARRKPRGERDPSSQLRYRSRGPSAQCWEAISELSPESVRSRGKKPRAQCKELHFPSSKFPAGI